MDQILANLADAVPDTFTDVSGEDAELPGEINDVMQAFECVATTPDPKLEPISVDMRLEKAAEKQTYLQSRHRNLQMRINRLRAQKLSCNARDVLCSVVTSCDKRRARMNGDVSVEPKLAVKVQVGDEPEPVEAGPKKMRVKKYNKARTDEVLGQLHSQLRHVQSYLDPEATESSSGGESADETDKFQPGAELYAPLQERAKYRWHARRAQLASQWVWLQAQVSDLEYKIRQSTDGYRAQRLSKGSVQLGEEVVSWPLHAKVATLPGASGDSLPLSCPVPTKVYGAAAKDHEDTGSTDDEASMTCCRVRPVKRVRRRKLVDTHGLHHTVARAAKLSSVSCECLRPGQWCVLCTGRRSHSLSVSGSGERRGSRQETVALLDHSYHTVLSQPGQDTQLGLVLMESLANKKWLVRHTTGLGPVTPGQPAHLTKLLNINNKDNKEKKFKDKFDSLSLKRKYIKRKDKDGKIIKRRRKYDSERDPESRPDSPDQMIGGPVVGDLNIKAVRDGVERIRDKMVKKRKSSYDIDHIVIPMSMAATTRVERIKYKEILTPSWRETSFFKTDTEHESAPEEVKKETATDEKEETKENQTKEIKEEVQTKPTDEQDDFEENISDLAYRLRHVKAEEEERIRWATPLGRTHGGQRGHNQTSSGRSGRGRRLDSCRTEASSGANTPLGPLSPEAIEDIMVATRPSSPSGDHTPTVTSPPPPPDITSPASMASPPSIHALMPPHTPLSSVPASVRGRRRTSSQTKSRDRNLSEASQHSQESSRASSPWTEVEERAWSQPWEMRTFPLTDEEVKELENEDRLMLSRTRNRSEHASNVESVLTREPRVVTGARDATCPESVESSRATSRSVEVRLVKLRSESVHSRSSSLCLDTPEQEPASSEPGLVDPDWVEDNDDTEEDEVKDEAGADEDDPEYDPEAGDLNSHKSS